MTLSKELQQVIRAHPPSPDALRDLAQLREMTIPQLAAEYEQLFGKAPRVKNKLFMLNRCVWRREEQRTGGLSELARRRLESLIAQIKLPIGDGARTVSGTLIDPTRRELRPGTVLTKEWHGRRFEVRVLEDGAFELDGVRYRSLSAIASEITGVRWNGLLWFGLKDRSKRS